MLPLSLLAAHLPSLLFLDEPTLVLPDPPGKSHLLAEDAFFPQTWARQEHKVISSRPTQTSVPTSGLFRLFLFGLLMSCSNDISI